MPKNEIDFSAVKGVIWDLDNTLYRSSEAIDKTFNIAIARAAITAGADLEFGEAVKLATQSFAEYNYSGRVFVKEYGIDPDVLHFQSHGFVDEKLIEVCAETQTMFSQLRVENALVTHSSEKWAHKILAHLGLAAFFPLERVLAFEHYDFKRKSEDVAAFEMALSLLALAPHEVLMVEDTAPNLRIPHEMGMQTMFLHHGQRPEELPVFIHEACANTRDVLKKLL